MELPLYGRGDAAPTLTLQLLEAEAEEECPITLMAIAEAPPLRERLNKARLPCGHAFAAIPLLRHFARNRMRCPVCRGGVDARLDAARSAVELSLDEPEPTTTLYVVRIMDTVRLFVVEDSAELSHVDAMRLMLLAMVAATEA